MDDVERLVQAEIDRLKGPGFARTRRARQMRGATIRALAEATVANKPWTGPEGVLGPKRSDTIVSENNFYDGANWHRHPLVREVIDRVTELYAQRNAAARTQAVQNETVWLVNRELEAAHQQFDKAGELLKLPHLMRKAKKLGKNGEEITIIDPANAAVFGSAVRLNESASKLARRALGLPLDVQRSELTGAEGGPVQVQNDDGQTDEQRREKLAALSRIASFLAEGGERGTGNGADDDSAG